MCKECPKDGSFCVLCGGIADHTPLPDEPIDFQVYTWAGSDEVEPPTPWYATAGVLLIVLTVVVGVLVWLAVRK